MHCSKGGKSSSAEAMFLQFSHKYIKIKKYFVPFLSFCGVAFSFPLVFEAWCIYLLHSYLLFLFIYYPSEWSILWKILFGKSSFIQNRDRFFYVRCKKNQLLDKKIYSSPRFPEPKSDEEKEVIPRNMNTILRRFNLFDTFAVPTFQAHFLGLYGRIQYFCL